MLTSIAVGTIFALALKAAYAVANQAWPAEYVYNEPGTPDHSLQKLVRLLCWRLIPYLLTLSITASTTINFGLQITTVFSALYVVHILSTNGIAVANSIFRRNGVRASVAQFVGMSAVSGALTISAVHYTNLFAGLSPDHDQIITGIWTAIFVAFSFAAFRQFTGGNNQQIEKRKDYQGLDEYYVGELARNAYKFKVDLPLLLALVITENIARPKLIRIIEVISFKLMLPILKPKTLGIAQQSSRSAQRLGCSLRVYDKWSLAELAKAYKNCHPHTKAETFGAFEIKALANRNNRSPEYLISVARNYEYLFDGADALAPITPSVSLSLNPNLENFDNEACGGEGSLQLRAPWAVRSGDATYICARVRSAYLLGVSLTARSAVGTPLYNLTFDVNSEDFINGLYRIPNLGNYLEFEVRLKRHEVETYSFHIDLDSSSDISRGYLSCP